MIKRWVVMVMMLSMLVTSAFVTGGCRLIQKTPVTPETPEVTAERKIIKFQMKNEPVGLDPLFSDATVTGSLTAGIFEGLVAFKETSFEIEPALAERFEVGNKNLEYTFYLRKNVKFHDGSAFNADIVVKNFKRITDAAPMGISMAKKLSDVIDKVVKVDDFTVKVILKQPYTPFLATLAMNFVTPMVSASMIANVEEGMQKPIGTGPFRFVKWEHGKQIIIEKSKDYWGNKVAIDEIDFKLDAFASSNARTLLNSGEIDIIDLDNAKDDKNASYYKAQPLLSVFLALNCSKPPFNDINARKAFAYMINRQEIFERFFQGSGALANTYMPAEIQGSNGSLNFYSYNVSEGEKFAKAASAAIKAQKNVVAVDIYAQNPPLYQWFQSSLQKIGLNVEFKDNNSELDLGRILKEGAYNMMLVGWTCDNGDPDNFSSLYDSKSIEENLPKYSSKKLDDLIAKGNTLPYGEERNNVYKEIQSIVLEEAAIIPLFHVGRTFALSSRIKNFQVHPTGAVLFRLVSIN